MSKLKKFKILRKTFKFEIQIFQTFFYVLILVNTTCNSFEVNQSLTYFFRIFVYVLIYVFDCLKCYIQ